MPWKNLTHEDERRKFCVAAAADGVSFAALCRDYGVSRKTGYKWKQRYEQDGKHGPELRSRRPQRLQSWPAKWRRRLLAWRRQRPSWGGRLLWTKLRKQWPGARCPAVRTLERWLAQAGCGRRKRRQPPGPQLVRPRHLLAVRPNDVWAVDDKGPLTMMGRTIEPLTVLDLASRCGLAARVLPANNYRHTRRVLLELFADFGLPRAIQVDNGPPFGGSGARGLSRLTAEWVQLGIQVQFSRPASPQDNPELERWHRTLQGDLRWFASRHGETLNQRLERILRCYNTERSHSSLQGQFPADCYRPSRRRYRGVHPRIYPKTWITVIPNSTGRVWWAGRQCSLGRAFFGQRLGLRPINSGHWEVYLDYVLLGVLVDGDEGGLRKVALTAPPVSAPNKPDGEGSALP